MTAFLEPFVIIVLLPIALGIVIRVLLGIGVGILMAKNCIAPVLFLLIAAMPLRAQEISARAVRARLLPPKSAQRKNRAGSA